MNKGQLAQFKNDVEKICQPFKCNMGQTRTQTVPIGNSKPVEFQLGLNTYMVGGYNGDQEVERTRMLKEFYDGRDKAAGQKSTR